MEIPAHTLRVIKRHAKNAIIAWVASGSAVLAYADSSSISIYMTAITTNTNTNQVSTQNISNAESTGLATPTFYSVSSSLTGGSGLDTATVSLNKLHSYSYSTYPLDSTTSYSEGLVNITDDDFGTVPAGVTSMTNTIALMGTTSLEANLAPYDVSAIVVFDLLDLTTNTQSQAYFNLLRPDLYVQTATLAVHPGDQTELETTFDIGTYQAGNASESSALVDYSDTLSLYVDTNVLGTDFVDNSGIDYSSSLASSPEPGTLGLLGVGTLFLAYARGHRRRSHNLG
jgi:hypothetical protein